MENDLGNYRKSYEKGELLLSNVPENPMELFRDWFQEVDTHFNVGETNAMTISTFGLDGYPKSRIVLLKKYTYEGFIFYTNEADFTGKIPGSIQGFVESLTYTTKAKKSDFYMFHGVIGLKNFELILKWPLTL